MVIYLMIDYDCRCTHIFALRMHIYSGCARPHIILSLLINYWFVLEYYKPDDLSDVILLFDEFSFLFPFWGHIFFWYFKCEWINCVSYNSDLLRIVTEFRSSQYVRLDRKLYEDQLTRKGVKLIFCLEWRLGNNLFDRDFITNSFSTYLQCFPRNG